MITDEMVIAAANVIDPTHAFASTKRTAREILETALAGHTVIQLPEPDANGYWQISEAGTPNTSVEAGTVAVVLSVNGYDSILTPERARQIGLALIAGSVGSVGQENPQ